MEKKTFRHRYFNSCFHINANAQQFSCNLKSHLMLYLTHTQKQAHIHLNFCFQQLESLPSSTLALDSLRYVAISYIFITLCCFFVVVILYLYLLLFSFSRITKPHRLSKSSLQLSLLYPTPLSYASSLLLFLTFFFAFVDLKLFFDLYRSPLFALAAIHVRR